MTANISNVSKYQQINQVWKQNQTNKTKEAGDKAAKYNVDKDVKVTEWEPMDTSSSLVPTSKDGYGIVVGNVNLSEKAQDYYKQLKAKFGNMDFILVSSDIKSQVEKNASQYGNAAKPVVLIDDEKIERMANDESYRKKYEGILAMAQMKLESAKNSLASSGANVKNFGLSVKEDGKMSFFATVEKANDEQAKRIEKKQAEKKAAKLKEKKQAEKEQRQEALEKIRDKNKAEKVDDTEELNEEALEEDKEYIEFRSNDIDSLLNAVAKYAYDNSLNNVMTEEETMLGQNIDFKG